MKKRAMIGRVLGIVILALTLVAAGFYVYKSQTTVAQATEAAPVQTATVRRGDLVVSATGAGAVIPEEEVSVGFSSSGLLIELPVKVGDKVDEGAVLARWTIPAPAARSLKPS